MKYHGIPYWVYHIVLNKRSLHIDRHPGSCSTVEPALIDTCNERTPVLSGHALSSLPNVVFSRLTCPQGVRLGQVWLHLHQVIEQYKELRIILTIYYFAVCQSVPV